FFDLGGHSLKVTVLIHKIKKALNKDISIHQIFNHPTIVEQGKYLLNEKESLYQTIRKVEESEFYDASSAQKRMYILQKMDKDSTAYNISGKLEIIGEIDIGRLNNALHDLVVRHEILRTSFEMIDTRIVQKVHAINDIRVVIDVTDLESEVELDENINSFIQPFDLEKPLLLRICLFNMENYRKVLAFDMHHIISDGVSMSIITTEFCELYAGHQLEELPIQYKDYAAWQLRQKNTLEYNKQEAYWLKEFEGELPVLNMPTDYTRSCYQDFMGDSVNFTINRELTNKLNELARKTGTTLHMVLLSSLNILIARYSGQDDFVVGTPVAGRNHRELENLIGVFVNTIAIRTQITGAESFSEYLNKVKSKVLADYENQDYQFEELVEKVAAEKNLNRNPLFDIMFVLQNMDESKFTIENSAFKAESLSNATEKFDITMTAIEEQGQINVSLSYATSLYRRSTIERMVEQYLNILSCVTDRQGILIKDIDFLSDKERQMLLYDFNDTDADYPRNTTIHELFEKCVEGVPENIAVTFGKATLTYKELDEKANALARTFRKLGVKADDIVAIMVERSCEMIVGMLAILKAGGAYLPIDPSYPKDRIEYTLTDSGTEILVSTRKIAETLNITANVVDITDPAAYDQDSTKLKNINIPNNLAYVIYTSGTTGKPKGVMIEHKNVVRLMFNDKMQYDFNNHDVWTMFHSFCFDFSVWEMYGALLYGGRLVMVPKEVSMDTEAFLELLKSEKVTVLNQIPTPFYSLMNKELACPDKELSLRYVIFGGEELKSAMLKEWYEKYPATRLINMYGITETTVHVTFKEIHESVINERISNIGKPIPTLTTYIMNEDSKLLPIGVIGELCVGGDGVARGYLHKEELTAKKFIMNPYKKGERIYRSGDMARVLETGDLEYLGRNDFQVKIRGFRIELGEIESAVLKIEGIKEAIALAKGENENRYICAYYVGENEYNVGELRVRLKKFLPDYMIPSYFVALDSMPQTYNGKINRKALPEIDNKIDTGAKYEAPRNSIEEKLVEIWHEVLEVENIGINDNFFELGGHSLKATVLVLKIQKDMHKKILLRDIFMMPTIKELCVYLEKQDDSIYSTIEKVEDTGNYDTSSAQKRMYMLQQFDKESIAYNMPSVFVLNAEFDEKRIVNTFKELMERHEALKTYFVTSNDQIMQRIDKFCKFKLETTKSDDDIDSVIDSFVKPFNLSKAPLIRVRLLENSKKKFMMIDMHHIISDGVSMNILIRDFMDIYNGKKLEPLKLQYKDVAEWQNKLLNSYEIKKQKDFWLNLYKDEIPVLDLHTDYKRPPIKSFDGDEVNFELDGEILDSIKEFIKMTATTSHMLMLSVFYILLAKYCRQDEIVIGVPAADRIHPDLQDIIGSFVNTLALKNKPEGNKKYIDFLNEVKDNSIKAYENQSYQFETLIEDLNVRRDASRNPIFDVMFSMFDMAKKMLKI
ncbi:MAG: acyl carrier protein, partial [Ruminiclostridium sp.]